MDIKEYDISDKLPEDIRISLETLLEQTRIMEEYDLESIPGEYMANFMNTLSKHPEYEYVLMDFFEALIENEMI